MTMNKIFRTVAILTIPIAVYATANPPASQPVDAIVQEINELEGQWHAALVKGDLAGINKILAAEYVEIFGEGRRTREEVIKYTASGEYKPESIEMKDVNVRIYDGVVLVTGKYLEKSTLRGKDISGLSWLTDVFVKRDGRWQCVLTHFAQAPQS